REPRIVPERRGAHARAIRTDLDVVPESGTGGDDRSGGDQFLWNLSTGAACWVAMSTRGIDTALPFATGGGWSTAISCEQTPVPPWLRAQALFAIRSMSTLSNPDTRSHSTGRSDRPWPSSPVGAFGPASATRTV